MMDALADSPRSDHEADIDIVPLRLFHAGTALAAGLEAWSEGLDEIAALGFGAVVVPPPFATPDLRAIDDPDRPHPALRFAGEVGGVLAAIDAACRAAGLAWMLDVRVDAVVADGRLARAHAETFEPRDRDAALDPTQPPALAHLRASHAAAAVEMWSTLLDRWRRAGAAGFRLRGLDAFPGTEAARLIARQKAGAACLVVAVPDDADRADIAAWASGGLDRLELAIDDWDAQAPTLLERAAAWGRLAKLLAVVETPFGARLAARFPDPARALAAASRRVAVAASIADGWMMPDGFAGGARLRTDAGGHAIRTTPHSISPQLARAIRQANGGHVAGGAAMSLAIQPGIEAVGRRAGDRAWLTVVNRTDRPAFVLLASAIRGFVTEDGLTITLPAGEATSLEMHAAPLSPRPSRPLAVTAATAAAAGRVAIEAVSPAVDNGAFAVKRIVGDTVDVACDLVCDGHDQLSGLVQWQDAADGTWREMKLAPLGNDRWGASFDLTAIGRFVFRILAWRDEFATYRDELTKKRAAGLDVSLELREGIEHVARAAQVSRECAALLQRLEAAETADRARVLLSDEMWVAMSAADQRPLLSRSGEYPIDADRTQAAFASWYEIFPRSMAGAERHGTFRDVIEHLPRIAAMGFDVLYFPPIHPIGRTNRKGRNNSLTPGPDEPGSPYAIGSTEGGHDALHPELGTFEDFEALRRAAAAAGLELALDFAIQCAPDHPWLTQHRDWFDWRPDGSLRYAENPPKKYQDIVNVDFYKPESIPGLWVALAEIVFFWLARGVRIFRVDNPHTKPLAFWEWLIGEVRAAHPDAIFLAEAFTRPKVMNRLGKIGFHQSYTYFTWRNTAAELREYLTQLTTGPEAEFFRPNFFVNTPDINPPFLQNSGRAGFVIRATLAATLAGSWGLYCGFELCEATPLPGREEYLDSEKYQLRAWDWDRPGNIVAEVTRLNALRRRHPCLWTHQGVTFLPSDDPQVLFYEKATADRSDVLLIAVCVDPFGTHSAAIELPLWRWTLADDATVDCRDVLHDIAFTLTGKWQRVALSPTEPVTIWHVRPQGAVPA